jgi:hypothetical protein
MVKVMAFELVPPGCTQTGTVPAFLMSAAVISSVTCEGEL